jgi:hypothetical protein
MSNPLASQALAHTMHRRARTVGRGVNTDARGIPSQCCIWVKSNLPECNRLIQFNARTIVFAVELEALAGTPQAGLPGTRSCGEESQDSCYCKMHGS